MRNPQIDRAKELRHNLTFGERLIWDHIKSRQINNCKFRRQQEFGPYFLDFYCYEIKLAIEIDGDVHALPDQIAHDSIREKYLAKHGLKILHVNNSDLPKLLEPILEEIYSLTLTLSLRRGN